MENITAQRRYVSAREKHQSRSKRFKDPTREEIERAMSDFLSKGGKITKIEPQWIEEGSLYMFG